MAGQDVASAVTRLAREDGGRVLAVLARRFGDLDLADEAVQDGLVEALATWPARGVPEQPAAWLMTVAGRKALDRLRRTTSARRRDESVAADLVEREESAVERGLVSDDATDATDEQLRLVLLCCHPALGLDAQVALTLRLVGGLTTAEIATACLVPEATITQRVVRAKRKIRAAGIPLSIPAALEDRVGAVLAVLYLVFDEAHLSREHDGVVRVHLADEAIRLARLVRSLLPANPEAAGLLALLLYQRSRFGTRVSATGDLVRLEDQDRTRWDGAMIAEANAVLSVALQAHAGGPYAVQGVIASLHASAATHADTDWTAVVTAYARLLAVADSPVVRLNHAIAVAMADGAPAGLRLVEALTGLDDYHLLHATLATCACGPVTGSVRWRRSSRRACCAPTLPSGATSRVGSPRSSDAQSQPDFLNCRKSTRDATTIRPRA